MNKLLFFLITIPFFNSCNYCELKGETAIGSNFSVVEADSKYISIIYCTSKKCCDAGITIVPSFLLDYKYDDDWIVAKNETNGSIGFYIIDKMFDVNRNNLKDNVTPLLNRYIEGPLNFVEFRKKIQEKQIGLSFQE